MKSFFVFFMLVFFSSFSRTESADWIVQNSTGKVSQEEAEHISSVIYKKSLKHDVDPHVVFGLMKVESGFYKYAKNPDGSYGLMQIQANVHRKLLNGKTPYDVETNVDIGVGVYKYCLQRWKSISSALNCYNGRVRNNPFASKVLTVIRQLNN